MDEETKKSIAQSVIEKLLGTSGAETTEVVEETPEAVEEVQVETVVEEVAVETPEVEETPVEEVVEETPRMSDSDFELSAYKLATKHGMTDAVKIGRLKECLIAIDNGQLDSVIDEVVTLMETTSQEKAGTEGSIISEQTVKAKKRKLV